FGQRGEQVRAVEVEGPEALAHVFSVEVFGAGRFGHRAPIERVGEEHLEGFGVDPAGAGDLPVLIAGAPKKAPRRGIDEAVRRSGVSRHGLAATGDGDVGDPAEVHGRGGALPQPKQVKCGCEGRALTAAATSAERKSEMTGVPVAAWIQAGFPTCRVPLTSPSLTQW